jgi:predicted membrane metal-binding protein
LFIIYLTCLRNIQRQSYYRSFFIGILIAHIIFVLLSGELRTFRIFWLLYSMLFVMQGIKITKAAFLNIINPLTPAPKGYK